MGTLQDIKRKLPLYYVKIFAVINTIAAIAKQQPEKIQALTGFKPVTFAPALQTQ